MDEYAVIIPVIIHIPGDERSRQAPGHGYPAEDREVITIQTFNTKEEWEAWIRKETNPRFGSPKKFTPIIYRKARVVTTTTVEIS